MDRPLPIQLEVFIAEIGDRDTALGILMKYREQAEGLLLEIHRAFSENKWEEVHRIAHKIRGGALNIGAHRLAISAGQLMKGSSEESPQGGARLIETMEQEFQVISNYIASFNDEKP
jgi:HPt (histidine-containing phosphotransfer) domain-containing protein